MKAKPMALSLFETAYTASILYASYRTLIPNTEQPNYISALFVAPAIAASYEFAESTYKKIRENSIKRNQTSITQ